MAQNSSAFIAILFLLVFVEHCWASSSFKPNCTLPPSGTNYVAEPNIRSTIGIFWNCLSIIILCTWNIQHLNVPVIRQPHDEIEKMLWAIWDSRVKIKWMIVTILVPEFLVGKALGELLSACENVKDMNAAMHDNKIKWVPWELVHAYMANMGYFVFDWGDRDCAHDSPQTNAEITSSLGDQGVIDSVTRLDQKIEQLGNDMLSAIQSKKDGRVNNELQQLQNNKKLKYHVRENVRRLHSGDRYWALDARQCYKIFTMKPGAPEPPKFHAAQLEKLDKGGTLVKALAIIQVSYLILQLIVRKVEGLPSTQLEIATLAFSASSIVTYGLYWYRPQGIETICILKAKGWGSVGSEDVENVRLTPLEAVVEDGPRYFWVGPRTIPKFDPKLGPTPIPNDCSHWAPEFPWRSLFRGNDEILPLILGAVIGGAIFGGLHCLAWNFVFPTQAERLIWRTCSVLTTCLPLLFIFPMVLRMRLNSVGVMSRDEERSPNYLKLKFFDVVIILILGPYFLARLFLMVEIFRSLLFLPPEAFIDTWSGLFPHWG